MVRGQRAGAQGGGIRPGQVTRVAGASTSTRTPRRSSQVLRLCALLLDFYFNKLFVHVAWSSSPSARSLQLLGLRALQPDLCSCLDLEPFNQIFAVAWTSSPSTRSLQLLGLRALQPDHSSFLVNELYKIPCCGRRSTWQ